LIPMKARVKHLLEKYKERKTDYNKIQEAEKYENLKKKYDIIDKIKDLVNREESINKTFMISGPFRMNGIQLGLSRKVLLKIFGKITIIMSKFFMII